MKRVKKYSKCMLWFLTCLILATIKGCGDNQSNEVIYVNNFKIVLFYHEGSPDPPALDFWNVSEDGRDITRIGHAYFLQLRDEEGEPYQQGGIRVDIEVVDHGSIAGFGDIWEDEALGGEKYGFLACYPEEGSGKYDGVLHGRTNGQGQLIICCGLGDPKGVFDPNDPLDYNYELPGPGGDDNDDFDTWVELKITVPRRNLPFQPAYVWGTFIRVKYQNMWEPYWGVYGNSYSGLGHWLGGFMSMQSVSSESATFEISTFKKTPKDNSEKYSLIGSKIETMNAVSNSGVTLDSLVLAQLRWDYVEPWGWGWYYFLIQPGEDLRALWANPNDPNAVKEALSVSEPYAYFADITSPEPFDGNTAITTVHLRAIDSSSGQIVSKVPYPMHFYGKSPDNKTLTFMSWFVISEDPNFQGQYEDKWGNPYTVFYMPERSYPDVNLPENGDYNADDKTDWQDLVLFSEHWLNSLESETIDLEELGLFSSWWLSDCNTTNNWCAGFDTDESGEVNFRDFAEFADSWMTSTIVSAGNYDLAFEEPNNWDGYINFKDFAAFAKNWLKEFN